MSGLSGLPGIRTRIQEARRLRAAGTPGEWGVGNGSDIATGVEVSGRGSYMFEHMIARLDDTDFSEDYVEPRSNDADEEDDAALIVAAVNLLVPLAAAVEAVLDLPERTNAASWAASEERDRGYVEGYNAALAAVRAVVVAPFEEGTQR